MKVEQIFNLLAARSSENLSEKQNGYINPDHPLNRDVIERAKTYADVVTPEQANRIFSEIVQIENLALEPVHIYAGCYARTHVICAKIFDLGVIPQKAWARRCFTKGLSVQRENEKTEYKYHVAPALMVRMPDGKDHFMVLDPVLFDKPMDFDAWRKAIGAEEGLSVVAAYNACAQFKHNKQFPTRDSRMKFGSYSCYSDVSLDSDDSSQRLLADIIKDPLHYKFGYD